MIVDDSLLLRKRLLDIIQVIDNSLKIVQAENAAIALIKFKTEKPAIIILDIALPDKSGISVLKTVKESAPETKVIIFTDYPREQFKEKCLKLRADYFVSKSDEFGELPFIISDILNKEN
jgi:DNA-binding NarL/FixJ family response regulator